MGPIETAVRNSITAGAVLSTPTDAGSSLWLTSVPKVRFFYLAVRRPEHSSLGWRWKEYRSFSALSVGPSSAAFSTRHATRRLLMDI